MIPNPFRRRVRIPIRRMPGGWEPWNNRQPPKAMSWRPFILAGGGMLAICGILYSLWMTFLAPTVEPTPTFDVQNLYTHVGEVIYFEETPAFRSSRFENTETSTPTLTATHTPTVESTVTQGDTPLSTIQPTYTPYPTYTVQPQQIRQIQEVVITSPPEIIYRDGGVREVIREVPLEITVEVIHTVVVLQSIVVTATPSPTEPPPMVFTQPPPVYLLPPTQEE